MQKLFYVAGALASEVELSSGARNRESRPTADLNALLAKGWIVHRVDMSPTSELPCGLVTLERSYEEGEED